MNTLVNFDTNVGGGGEGNILCLYLVHVGGLPINMQQGYNTQVYISVINPQCVSVVTG